MQVAANTRFNSIQNAILGNEQGLKEWLLIAGSTVHHIYLKLSSKIMLTYIKYQNY